MVNNGHNFVNVVKGRTYTALKNADGHQKLTDLQEILEISVISSFFSYNNKGTLLPISTGVLIGKWSIMGNFLST